MANRSANSEVTIKFRASIQNTLDNGQATSAQISAEVIKGQIENGVGANQANRAWDSGNRSLGASANETLDFYAMSGIDIGAGPGKDALGQDCLFEEIIVLIIQQISGTGRLQVEPGTSNPLTALGSLLDSAGASIKTGGSRIYAEKGEDGIDLSATKRNVKFSAVGGSLVYRVLILGRSDDDESSSSSSFSSSTSSSVSSSTSSASSSSST